MGDRIRRYWNSFPRQMWVLAAGGFANSLGSAIVFPFLTLYLRQKLGISMAQIALVFTLNAITSLAAGMVGGLLADRLGRRVVILVSLASTSVVLFLMGIAGSYIQMVVLTGAIGITGPLFQPARDAMLADLIGPDRRAEAYSVLRVSSNLGFAIGPAIGGFLAATSYLLSFGLAAGASLVFFFLALFMVRETLPASARGGKAEGVPVVGFGPIFRDRIFMAFCGLMILTTIVYSQVLTNLPVYMKESFGLGESHFGWLMTTNGAMVVLLQLGITRATARWRRLPAMALGTVLYAVGVGAFSLTRVFPAFVACVAIYTLGEIILAPVSTAFTADLSPADMRGRYMGFLGLTWGAAYGIGPLLGGAIYDAGFARELWLFVGAVGLVAAAGFLLLQRKTRPALAPASE
jgi:MFS family permease